MGMKFRKLLLDGVGSVLNQLIHFVSTSYSLIHFVSTSYTIKIASFNYLMEIELLPFQTPTAIPHPERCQVLHHHLCYLHLMIHSLTEMIHCFEHALLQVFLPIRLLLVNLDNKSCISTHLFLGGRSCWNNFVKQVNFPHWCLFSEICFLLISISSSYRFRCCSIWSIQCWATLVLAL